MIPDRDIYRIAIAMIERYGASASTYAELEAEKLLDEGDEGNSALGCVSSSPWRNCRTSRRHRPFTDGSPFRRTTNQIVCAPHFLTSRKRIQRRHRFIKAISRSTAGTTFSSFLKAVRASAIASPKSRSAALLFPDRRSTSASPARQFAVPISSCNAA